MTDKNGSETVSPASAELCPMCRAADNHEYIHPNGTTLRACGRCMLSWKPESVSSLSSQAIGAAAKEAAEKIHNMADRWIEKKNFPTTNDMGREIFDEAAEAIILQAIEKARTK